jgi:hypothetical protein
MNKNDDDTLLGLRELILLILSAGIGVAVGFAEGVGTGLVSGLGAAAVLNALVHRN